MTQHTPHTPILVGIAGGTASGKSTLTGALVDALAVIAPSLRLEALSTDRYFRVGTPEMPTLFSPSMNTVLPDFNRPDSLDLPRFLADLDARTLAADAPDVLLIEGLMVLYWPEIRERLHLRLFVDLDDDTRALRRLVRNLGRTNDPLPDHSAQTIANYYLESAKVGHTRYVEPSRIHADLIVRGDADFARIAPMIGAVIRSRCDAQPDRSTGS